jgi:hypothetical protein
MEGQIDSEGGTLALLTLNVYPALLILWLLSHFDLVTYLGTKKG